MAAKSYSMDARNRHIDFMRERILSVLSNLEAVHRRTRIVYVNQQIVKIETFYEPPEVLEVIEKARKSLAYLDSKRV